jgi:hypothetical protein
VIYAEVSAPGVASSCKKKKGKKVESKNGEASLPANYATKQVLVAYGAGDDSKRASRGFSSLHSAHT